MSRMRITSLAIGLLWMLAMPLTAYGQSATLPLLPTEEGDSELQSMVDQLRAITEQAKRDRSADFRLLQQLDDLAGRYDQPWRITLLEDSFADGDFTANPAWARQKVIALRGNCPLANLIPRNRSSSAAATSWPSTISAAAPSWLPILMPPERPRMFIAN